MKAVLALEDDTIVKGIGFGALVATDAISLSNITYIINTGTVAINLTNPDNITVATAEPLIDIVFRAGEKKGITAFQMQNLKLTNNTGPHTPYKIINGSITVCIKDQLLSGR